MNENLNKNLCLKSLPRVQTCPVGSPKSTANIVIVVRNNKITAMENYLLYDVGFLTHVFCQFQKFNSTHSSPKCMLWNEVQASFLRSNHLVKQDRENICLLNPLNIAFTCLRGSSIKKVNKNSIPFF